jgi:hypothetical protein
LWISPFPQVNILVVLIFASNISGCGYVVSSEVYEKDKEKNQAQLEFIRRQMVAHTKILADHGRSINEIQVQVRESAAKAMDSQRIGKGIEKSVTRSIKEPSHPKSTKLENSPGTKIKSRTGFLPGVSLFIRNTYRGLPLNFAGGYRAPRGKRYPYKLFPGTLVEVISEDRRGFTEIHVKTGRWKGKKMWVRTRWLVQKPKLDLPSPNNG